jgi:hypothetical protein
VRCENAVVVVVVVEVVSNMSSAPGAVGCCLQCYDQPFCGQCTVIHTRKSTDTSQACGTRFAEWEGEANLRSHLLPLYPAVMNATTAPLSTPRLNLLPSRERLLARACNRYGHNIRSTQR